MLQDGEKITLDGNIVTVYLCDQKAECSKSKDCGKACKFTLDKLHRQKQTQLSL